LAPAYDTILFGLLAGVLLWPGSLARFTKTGSFSKSGTVLRSGGRQILHRRLEPTTIKVCFTAKEIIRAKARITSENCRWLQPTIRYYSASWPGCFCGRVRWQDLPKLEVLANLGPYCGRAAARYFIVGWSLRR